MPICRVKPSADLVSQELLNE